MSIIESPNNVVTERTPAESDRFSRMRAQTERRAYAMALQLTRNSTDAQDLVQDTYLKAWRGFDSYTPGRPFLNWLLRIMQHAYLDSRRRENPIRKAESIHSMVSPNNGEVQELQLPDNAMSAEDGVLMEEFRQELRRALNELPDVYRTAIEMCDIEELSYADIADRQNTTIGTVRSRIHRGRKLLREIIQARGVNIPIR